MSKDQIANSLQANRRRQLEKASARALAIEAARAHTNLVLFATIERLACSPDLNGSASQRDGERIVKICKAAIDRQLTRYDSALDEIGSPL